MFKSFLYWIFTFQTVYFRIDVVSSNEILRKVMTDQSETWTPLHFKRYQKGSVKTKTGWQLLHLSFLWLIMIKWVYTQIDFNFQFDFNGMCCLIFFLSFPMFWLESHEDEWKQEDFVWMDHGHRLLHFTNIYFVSLFML